MAAPKGKQKPGVKLEDLHFYFDGVERERLDSAGWSHRAAEVLVLRDSLLKLPAPAFDAAIQTMRNVVGAKPVLDNDGVDGEKSRGRRDAAGKLFEQVQADR